MKPPTPGTPGVPAPRPPLARPRRVRGGVKLEQSETALHGWAAQRWLRLVEQAADGDALREGLEYAQQGQARRMALLPGRIEGLVQGRADRAYVTVLRVPTFSAEQWERIAKAMAEAAVYSAKLLAGELPSNIDDVLDPIAVSLFPAAASEMVVSCTCERYRAMPAFPGQPPPPPPPVVPPEGVWCKHVCCLAYLFAERLTANPFVMFAMRGLEGEELVERVRQARAVSGAATGSSAVYTQRLATHDASGAPPLDADPSIFWSEPAALRDLDLPLDKPTLSHPLLRRLGPSPFPTGLFPLVGLLASAYDTISQAARGELPPPEPADDQPDEGSKEGGDGSGHGPSGA